MRDLEDFLPRVLEKAPNCPEPTALRYIRDAAITFCRRTRIWRDRDSFAVASGDCEVIAVPPGTMLYEISHAEFDGCELTATTFDKLDKERTGWRTEVGPPDQIAQSAPNTVRVVPAPEESGTLSLELILLPSRTADKLPDVLFDHYQDVIADGALGVILLLPATEFANAELGAEHKMMFEQALGHWSDRVPRGQQRAKRRTRVASTF